MSATIMSSKKERNADRRSREVFRYFQPANPAALNSTWLPYGDDSTSAIRLAAATRQQATEASTSVRTTPLPADSAAQTLL